MSKASFQADQEVPGDACWLRHLVRSDYINRDGTLNHQALKGAGAFSQAQGKSWAHELSGAIVSLAGAISDMQLAGQKLADDAQSRFAATHEGKTSSKIRFAGVMCATGRELKTVVEEISTAVVYTPSQPAEPAHADFVTYGTTTEPSLNCVRDWLLFNVRIIRHDQLAQLATCGS